MAFDKTVVLVAKAERETSVLICSFVKKLTLKVVGHFDIHMISLCKRTDLQERGPSAGLSHCKQVAAKLIAAGMQPPHISLATGSFFKLCQATFLRRRGPTLIPKEARPCAKHTNTQSPSTCEKARIGRRTYEPRFAYHLSFHGLSFRWISIRIVRLVGRVLKNKIDSNVWANQSAVPKSAANVSEYTHALETPHKKHTWHPAIASLRFVADS